MSCKLLSRRPSVEQVVWRWRWVPDWHGLFVDSMVQHFGWMTQPYMHELARGIVPCLRIWRVATQPKKTPASVKNDWCVGFAAEHVWEWIVSSCFGEPKQSRSWSCANELSLKTRAWPQIFKLCASLPYLHPVDVVSGGRLQFCRFGCVFSQWWTLDMWILPKKLVDLSRRPRWILEVTNTNLQLMAIVIRWFHLVFFQSLIPNLPSIRSYSLPQPLLFLLGKKNWWCASLFISSLSQWPNLRSSKVNIAPPRKDCQIFTLLETNNLGLKIDLSGASCFFWVYIFGSSCHFSWKECKLLMIHVRLTNNDNGENPVFYTIYICKWLIFWLLC